MNVTIAAMLNHFKIDNTGDILALQDYTRHRQMPWYAELFGFFTCFVTFAVAFIAVLDFCNQYSDAVLWTAATASIAWLFALFFWFSRMLNVWTLAVCPLIITAGFAVLVALAVLLAGQPWPVIPAFATSIVLARIRVSFSLSFLATLVLCVFALSAVGGVFGQPDYVIGAASLLSAAISFVLFMFPVARWDWRGHAFALLAFSLALLLFVYIAHQLMFDIGVARPIEYALKIVSALFIAWGYGYAGKNWKIRKAAVKQALLSLLWLLVFLAIIICLFRAGVIVAFAAAMLGYVLASRQLMILGFLSAGTFAVTTYVYLSNWIISSGFFIFIESVFLYFWRG